MDLTEERATILNRATAQRQMKMIFPEGDDLDLGLMLEEYVTKHSHEDLNSFVKIWVKKLRENPSEYASYKARSIGGTLDYLIQLRISMFGEENTAARYDLTIEELRAAYPSPYP